MTEARFVAGSIEKMSDTEKFDGQNPPSKFLISNIYKGFRLIPVKSANPKI
jgi:hypothetical protein